jgi:predicted CXXCH cytochrome family protein
MLKRNARKSVFAYTAIAAIIGIFAVVRAQDKKEIPDHANFQDCKMCHADKQSMWEASGHSKAIGRMTSGAATADCYACHSTEGFAAKRQGGKVDIAKKDSFHTVSCLACHDPKNSKLAYKLVASPEDLCESCHRQRAMLKGEGAKGMDDVRNVHSAVTCVSCHMTEANHRMKVLRPDDPGITDKRIDTCTGCHKDGNRTARAKQLQEWQSDYKEKMDPLQTELKAVNAALKEKPDALNAELKEKLKNLTFNLSMLERDGAQAAHNHDYAMEIMSLAATDLKAVKAALK